MWVITIVFLYVSNVVSGDIYKMGDHTIRWCRSLRFDNKIMDQVALVAFPGSGATWLRYLLQQVTGVYTSSVTPDSVLEHAGLASVVTEGVLMVAQTDPLTEKSNCIKAVVLVRDPQDTMMALYHMLHGGLMGSAPPDSFKGPQWVQFIKETVLRWSTFYTTSMAWIQGPIHIVVYEELVRNTRKNLVEILDFIEHAYSEENLECAIHFKESPFKRKPDNSVTYTKPLQRYIDKHARLVLDAIHKYQENDTRIWPA